MGVDPEAARKRAASLLSATGDRWLHTRTAAAAAAEAACTVAEENRGLLVAAAWLHDIGYVHPDPPTGFHPLDGAYLLLDEGWPRRLVSLVAHHSEARFAASAQGLERELRAFDREEGPVTDALVYADMTSGPDGRRLHLRERLDDVHRRHAGEPARLRAAKTSREPFIVLAAARVDVRLHRLGREHHPALPVRSTPEFSDLLAEPVAEQRGRDELDVHAAVHAALGMLGTATGRTELRQWSMELLANTSAGPPGSRLSDAVGD
jgi:HD superfamily phosphodiesterase